MEASTKEISTYHPPRSGPFVGGRRVKLTDRILAIKMHGLFDQSAPPGAKSTATLALAFYDATTQQDLGFRQMRDSNAPDLGVEDDAAITSEAAARWWGQWRSPKRVDLELLHVPVPCPRPAPRQFGWAPVSAGGSTIASAVGEALDWSGGPARAAPALGREPARRT